MEAKSKVDKKKKEKDEKKEISPEKSLRTCSDRSTQICQCQGKVSTGSTSQPPSNLSLDWILFAGEMQFFCHPFLERQKQTVVAQLLRISFALMLIWKK